jgi:hypothetical protein
LLEAILERVGHRDELHIRVGCQSLCGSPGAAVAAANETNLQQIITGCVCVRQGTDCPGKRDRLEEIAPRR